MASARHRRPAPPRSRRDPRRLGALAVVAGVAGLGAVAGPVAGAAQGPGQHAPLASLTAPADATMSAFTGVTQARDTASDRASRDDDRQQVVTAAADVSTADVVSPLAVPGSTPAFAQEDTSVRAEPRSSGKVLADLERGAPVALTGNVTGGYAELVVNGALAWVRAADVDDSPPPKEVVTTAGPVSAEVSGAACSGGGGVESGLRASTIEVHRAVCAEFPGLVYGGVRPGDPGEHGSGRALDIMVSGAKGDQVAAYLQVHATELGIDNLIWKQRIWFVGKPYSSWQGMEDRGSATANHYDHVHVGTR